MKIIDTALKNIITGKDFKDENGKKITVFSTCVNILGVTRSSNPLLSYELSLTLLNKNEVELTSEDISHIKAMVTATDTYTPTVIGQILAHFK